MKVALLPISATFHLMTIANGWGPVELDRSNGPAQPDDGNIITINGVTYDKGIGCHAYSELVWYLGGKAISFMSDIGLDDEMTGAGSIVFEVYLDDVLAYPERCSDLGG